MPTDTLPSPGELVDEHEAAAILSTALPLLDTAASDAVVAALTEVAPDAADIPALERRQERLRGLLVAAMPAILADRGDAYRAMVAHMRARAERFPFAISATLPKPPAKRE